LTGRLFWVNKISGWIEYNKEQDLCPQGDKKSEESFIIFSFKGFLIPVMKTPWQKVLLFFNLFFSSFINFGSIISIFSFLLFLCK
jgi:hypothetical protein